jgi:Ni,Fe-hydrogenase I large subunit
MANLTGTYQVDPVSRIEGHLGIKITSDGTGVTEASAHGNLWRGFENFLLGRNVNDAITFTQRICGVCPVPHGMTATYAADTVLGYSAGHITFATSGNVGVPKKAVHIRNLVLGSEFLMSSITHFYHLAAPSYIQGPAIPPWTPYFGDGFYATGMLSNGRAIPQLDADGFSHDLWSTIIRSYVQALRIRRLTFEAGALFAGRMPMTSVYIGGGVTFDSTENLSARCDQFMTTMKEVGKFIIEQYVPIALALSVLYPTYDNVNNSGSGYGSGVGRYLAWGGFPNPNDDTLALKGGAIGVTSPFTVSNKADVATYFLPSAGIGSVKANLKEDITNAHYGIDTLDTAAYNASGAAYPGSVARTKPNRSAGYSYIKAPRWNGQACEVGPLARMNVMTLWQNNVLLATSVGAAYTAYTVKTILTGPYNSLDPAMIDPDVAVALVKSNLANLKIGSDVYGTYSGSVASGTGYVAGSCSATAAFPTATSAIVAAYTNANAEIVGPIADHIVLKKGGQSTMDRLLARAIESLYLVQQILGAYTKPSVWGATDFAWAGGWVAGTGGLKTATGGTWTSKQVPMQAAQGWGGTEAPRGALMHQVSISGGKITKYQCIVPTTWNASPRDYAGNRGAIEQACIGVPFSDAATSFTNVTGGTSTGVIGGVEVLRVAQSFDPCIACAVH